MTLTEALARRVEHPYLVRWFAHREALKPWPTDDHNLWVRRAARSIEAWSQARDESGPLDRQEAMRLSQLREGGPLAEAAAFAASLYPAATTWTRSLPDDEDHRRALAAAWDRWRADRRRHTRELRDAADLPPYYEGLVVRMRKLADAEAAVKSLLTDRDIGWDLDQGAWDDVDFRPLVEADEMLRKEPALTRVAELLGRDYRARTRPPQALPPEQGEPEPGRTELRGVRFGNEWESLISSEAALLAFSETQNLFFKKAAEAELLVWDHASTAPPEVSGKSRDRKRKNERGPVILVLDTSGSMRGEPERIAKSAVLALLRVALEEDRACYLINFSSSIRCLDLSNVHDTIPELLRFLEFSFHGGTHLGPALQECLRMLAEARFHDADVLVCSDFAVPKIAADLRRGIRRQQEDHGTRFYSLTVSVRPLNDFLNIFDAGWVYNIHPYQTNGIAPESLEMWG